MFLLRTRILSEKYTLHVLRWATKARDTSTKSSTYQTMKDIRIQLYKILDVEFYSFRLKPKGHLMKYMPKSQQDIPVRKMRDSFDTAVLPLSTDFKLKEKYITYFGSVRIGKLLEDVDTFAVWCCVKHLIYPEVKDRPFPFTIVTVLIDRIEMLKSLTKFIGDIRISGNVCWVGKTSIEVVVHLEQSEDGEWKPVTHALLLMAVRNSLNTGAAIANMLQAETPEEEEMIRKGEERKLRRQQMQSNSIWKKMPTEEELNIIHTLFMKTIDSKEFFLGKRVLPPKSRWMSDATLHTQVLGHPENKNLHNKIFGGFLARQALELSWVTAFHYGEAMPHLVKISDIGFFHPVDVGALVKFGASITYTENEYIQVFVFAEAYSGVSFSHQKHTTSFYFTYNVGQECDTIYPATYLEAMKYIDGRRHFYDEPIAIPISKGYMKD